MPPERIELPFSGSKPGVLSIKLWRRNLADCSLQCISGEPFCQSVMSELLKQLKSDLRGRAGAGKAESLRRFFKTGAGEYGYGDKFLGVVVPDQREIAKKYFSSLSLKETEELLRGVFHEERLTALLIMVLKFAGGSAGEKERIFKIYLKNLRHVNNWDLVDLSAPKIVGAYLSDKDKNILSRLSRDKHLWSRRVAIISTFYFISRGECAWTMKIAKILLRDKHDLIHKAVGWMLREAGKRRGREIERKFLDKHAARMPRTMLRYAIEKFSPAERKKYLSKKSFA